MVRWGAANSLGAAFPHLPDKKQAWEDLIRLTKDKDSDVRRGTVNLLGAAFPHVLDKKQAWDDLHRLTKDEDKGVRRGVAGSLGAAFPHVPDKKQAWEDLIRLTKDEYSGVRVSSNHSLGRASIFKATEAESEENFRKEIENALAFFEKSSREATFFNPARFCHLFYRSFYIITFQQTAEAEVQKYLVEAKSASEGSENKKKLLEAVENLASALMEVQKAREANLDIMECDLNAYRQYCERAADLLDTTEGKSPRATELLKRGLPIIGQRINDILAEIQKNAEVLSKETKGTSLEELGNEINRIGKKLSLIRDPIGLEKQTEIMEFTLSSICDKMSKEERGEACKLLKMAKEEQYIEDKLSLFNMILSKIPTQISKVKDIEKIVIKGPVQIAVGNGNVQEIDSSAKSSKEEGKNLEKRKNYVRDEEPEKNIVPYLSELESEIRDIFKSVYQKYREKGESDANSKTLAFLKHKLHDLAAGRRSFKWLDVGCGYGRALDVLDAINVPRNIFEYHGIDTIHKYLDDAEKQAKKYKLVDPKIEKMDAAQMDFDSEFDLVSAVLVLHEVDPLCLPYIIKNMIHALKPDGTLVISDFLGPYEQEEEIVAWSADDIELVLENLCDEAKVSFEPMPADKYPKELGFYACYVKKSSIGDKTFGTFMENYREFLEHKKSESRDMRNELRRQIKERVKEILGRSDIDTKNISNKEMERITGGIGDEYGIKAYKIRLLNNQIDFLDCKIQDFNRGNRCGGLR